MEFLGKTLGKNHYPFIVAEISCNHEGSLTHAKELIAAAKEAGADAVKFQLYDADDMTYIFENVDFKDTSIQDFIIKAGPWKGRALNELYTKTGTPYEWVQVLFEYAKSVNIPLFASVFSSRGIKVLEENNCPAYKIASFELVDIPLIREVAKTKKPIVLSTGMAIEKEIWDVADHIESKDIILLHCVSAYPTRLEETNLWRIKHLSEITGELIGFSDHTEGHLAAQIACGMGAVMIEKHLYLGGATSEDAGFSLTPQAFKFFVKACRRAAETSFESTSIEESYSRQFRRSLYAVKDISKGEQFTTENVRSIRPSYGLPPSRYFSVLSKIASTNIKAGTALKEEHLEDKPNE